MEDRTERTEMRIQMLGIDHSVASLEEREKFSFTKTRLRAAVQEIAQLPGVGGCVMLSTCNRMEVYLSAGQAQTEEVYRCLCARKGQDPEQHRAAFVRRSGMDAVQHLFALAAGMESRIVGEDQILMQVKQALSEAREAEATDKVMEVLFRMAVTAGKQVKTEITFHKANSSAISSAVEQLGRKGYSFAGQRCLVIGNGEMGKLTATALREQGADVTVTVRQYRSGVVEIPQGCRRINYGERYDYLPQCTLIVSATASPNLTLRREEIEKLNLTEPKLFLDLAVPRDIDPEIGTLPYATVYDIDSFAVDRQSAETREQMRQAQELLRGGIEEFVSWYECKDFVPQIQRISRAAAKDVCWRTGKAFGEVTLPEDTQEHIEQSIVRSSAKVVSKLLFALRDAATPDTLRACLEAFAEAYPEEEA